METGATRWMALPPWLSTTNHNLFQVVFEHEFAQKHGKAFGFSRNKGAFIGRAGYSTRREFLLCIESHVYIFLTPADASISILHV